MSRVFFAMRISSLKIVVAVSLLLGVACIAYLPGLGGSLHFDDYPNLGGLATADSFLKRLDFVFSGEAGPIGRPLALATFSLQQSAWPENVTLLLATNLSFHLIAGVAVYLLAWALARSQSLIKGEQHTLAILTTGFWLLSPLLASTQLMLVQRMATLSGLFVFLGLAAYAWGRVLHLERPVLGSALTFVGLLVGTGLATLSKENGALLPLLALTIEYTLLRVAPQGRSSWTTTVSRWLIWGGTAFILLYLASRLPGLLTHGGREYSALARFLTQPMILWEYVWHLAVPSVSVVSPFTDDVKAISSLTDRTFILSTIAWILMIASAFWYRTRYRVWSFSVFFFLGAHLLESSVINLELYFPHRNYVAAFAVYFGLSYATTMAPRQFSTLLRTGAFAYLAMFAVILWSATSLWGNPRIAAEIWAINQPDSARAQHYLAGAYVDEGDLVTAHRLLDQLASRDGGSGLYATQRLLLCQFEWEDQARSVEITAGALRTSRHENGLGVTFDLLTDTVLSGGCPRIGIDDIESLLSATEANPRYAHDTNLHAKIATARARLADNRGDLDASLEYMRTAYSMTKSFQLGIITAATAASALRFDEALNMIRSMESDAPKHPIRRLVWRERLARWIELLEREKADYDALIAKGAPLDEFMNRQVDIAP